MCIQFVVVLFLWYCGRNRAPSISNTQNGKNVKTDVLKNGIPIEKKVGNGHTKPSSGNLKVFFRHSFVRNCIMLPIHVWDRKETRILRFPRI